MAREQDQFLEVIDRDAAEARWLAQVPAMRLDAEHVPLAEALGRVLAEDIAADVDVPAFDRSNVDGFALRAEETFGASDESPQKFVLNSEEIPTGNVPEQELLPGTAASIATGGMLPRGADAVVMVEFAQVEAERLLVYRPVAPGANVSFAGTDMARGERVCRRGTVLSARETGVLAAIGRSQIPVVRRPRVAILSTGDELIAPGASPRPAAVYDANATSLADAVRELGGLPHVLGIIRDDEQELAAALQKALNSDLVLISGGTSKGAGDLSYRVLAKQQPGIVVHGVALKPGKPVCLGAIGKTPVAILPGFPTSAIFTFHEFVAPRLRQMLGLGAEARRTIAATMPARVNSERGRTEYLLVNLVEGPAGLAAYPMGKGSGSVTTFSRADGFVIIPRQQEYLEAGEPVGVVPLGARIVPGDLMVIGSHCIGLDALLSWLADEVELSVKTLWVGSQGGLAAAARGECDIAGIHLLDVATDRYNVPFLPEGVRLLPGYGRMQGLVYRPGDARFEGKSVPEAVVRALDDATCVMVNRNRGSGTRVLIDALLAGRKPGGFAVEVKSHHGVASAILQRRADWGLAIATLAQAYGLGFLPLRAERYDFAVPSSRWDRPAVAAFREFLGRVDVRQRLATLGFLVDDPESHP